jgi:hypothetical protein
LNRAFFEPALGLRLRGEFTDFCEHCLVNRGSPVQVLPLQPIKSIAWRNILEV